jgi:UDP-N-acetylglucosamine 2-epimerase (non-hydrolysing)
MKEGVDMSNVFFVGNTMIDTLVAFEEDISRKSFSFEYDASKPYLAMTLHRPSNVDNLRGLLKILKLLQYSSEHYQVIFPMHPRTLKNIERHGLKAQFNSIENVVYTSPMDYFTFQKLLSYSFGVITDSGGIQEETTFLNVPCVTLRENTERPVTIDTGTNVLLNFDPPKILDTLKVLRDRKSQIPPLWDGKASERIVQHIQDWCANGMLIDE